MTKLFFDSTQLHEIKRSLSEYDTDERYKNEGIDINILPQVCGDFYVSHWQPVQNTTHIYTHYKNSCLDFKRLMCVALFIGFSSLVSLFLFNQTRIMSYLVVDLMVLVSISSFILSLIQYLRIKRPILK
jgi:hypothetical protein